MLTYSKTGTLVIRGFLLMGVLAVGGIMTAGVFAASRPGTYKVSKPLNELRLMKLEYKQALTTHKAEIAKAVKLASEAKIIVDKQTAEMAKVTELLRIYHWRILDNHIKIRALKAQVQKHYDI